jgi:hypothetical protein
MLRSLSPLLALLLAQAGCFFDDSGSAQSESRGSTDEGADDQADDGDRDAGDAEDGGEEGDADGDDGDGEDDGDDDDGECEKIEDEEIGAEVAIEVGSTTVSFGDWVEKEDSPGEYVGFTLTVEGGAVSYRVKAGGEVFADSETTWIHPNGTSGSEAKAISNVEVCEDGDGEDDGDSEDGGDGEDDDDGGDDSDGHDDDDGSDDGDDVDVS